MEMEEQKQSSSSSSSSSDGGGIEGYWWWSLASAGQATAGITYYRKGFNGDSRFMPLRAFAVASLFVGAGASAISAGLKLSGITKVKDLEELGENIRRAIGAPSRARRTRETKTTS